MRMGMLAAVVALGAWPAGAQERPAPIELTTAAQMRETIALAIGCRLRTWEWVREMHPLVEAEQQRAIALVVERDGLDRQYAVGFVRGAAATYYNATVERISVDRGETCRDLPRIATRVQWLEGMLR